MYVYSQGLSALPILYVYSQGLSALPIVYVYSQGPSALPTVDVTELRMAEKVQALVSEDETGKGPVVRSESQEFVNMTDLELTFVLKEVGY